jgi:hypothetical protein
MNQPLQTSIRIPVVAVLCALMFLGYGLGASPEIAVVCEAAQVSDTSSAKAGERIFPHCQVRQERRLSGLPAVTIGFNLQDTAITSSLCDNTPRGGVRFCHRLTLIGDQATVTLPEIRTPLPATTLTDRLRRFIADQGSSDTSEPVTDRRLSWTTPHSLANQLSTVAIGVLLSVTAWGLWDIKWPPLDPSPLSSDGEPSSNPKLKSKKD